MPHGRSSSATSRTTASQPGCCRQRLLDLGEPELLSIRSERHGTSTINTATTGDRADGELASGFRRAPRRPQPGSIHSGASSTLTIQAGAQRRGLRPDELREPAPAHPYDDHLAHRPRPSVAAITNGGFERAGRLDEHRTTANSTTATRGVVGYGGGRHADQRDSTLAQTSRRPRGHGPLARYRMTAPNHTYDWASVTLRTNQRTTARPVARFCTTNGPGPATTRSPPATTTPYAARHDETTRLTDFTLFDGRGLGAAARRHTAASGITNGTFESGLTGGPPRAPRQRG